MPDPLATEALSALEAAFSSLMPAGVPAGLGRNVLIDPQRIRPLGLGGFVGNHHAPDAALYGRRVTARVELGVTGGNDNSARQYLSGMAAGLLASSRSELAALGIHRLSRLDTDMPRAIAFSVDFEFIPIPAASTERITEVVLSIEPDG
jgi:hypothetical protein